MLQSIPTWVTIITTRQNHSYKFTIKLLEIKCVDCFLKKKVLIFIMPFCSHTSSTVIKQDITENNMNTEMLKQTQLLADNHTELKFSLCSLYVF